MMQTSRSCVGVASNLRLNMMWTCVDCEDLVWVGFSGCLIFFHWSPRAYPESPGPSCDPPGNEHSTWFRTNSPPNSTIRFVQRYDWSRYWDTNSQMRPEGPGDWTLYRSSLHARARGGGRSAPQPDTRSSLTLLLSGWIGGVFGDSTLLVKPGGFLEGVPRVCDA